MNELNKTDKKHILWCMGVIVVFFVVSIWLGYYTAATYPELIQDVLVGVEKKVGIIFNNPAPWSVFAKLFFNNALASFLPLASGILLGIAPIVFIFANGYIIGMVAGAAPLLDTSLQKVIIAVLPHGVFELPALVMAAGYGLWLGYRSYRFLRYRDKFKPYLVYAFKKYVWIILPLLFIAALIEVFITPLVIGK